VFDRSGSRAALVRFEGDPEVHVLRPVAAAGGDEIYRTENGDIALRLSRTGSFTVYTRNNRLGAPAAGSSSMISRRSASSTPCSA
jgi:hypothetical protein